MIKRQIPTKLEILAISYFILVFQVTNHTVAIRSIFDISEMESSLTVQYTMLVEWYDERLKFKPFMENNKLKDSITLNGNLLKDKGEHF